MWNPFAFLMNRSNVVVKGSGNNISVQQTAHNSQRQRSTTGPGVQHAPQPGEMAQHLNMPNGNAYNFANRRGRGGSDG